MSKGFDWILSTVLRALVLVTPRRILRSLSWHAGKFVRQWQYTALDLRKDSWFDHFLLNATAHPWKFLGAATFIWSSIAATLIALNVCWHLLPNIWDKSDQTSYFGTAWTVQATIVALIYPLVTSFVTLMLQRRATAKVALTAYLLKTGVKPSGSSSFALLVMMTLQYLALPWMSEQVVQAVIFADIVWLGVNLCLTGRFLSHTAQYLQDESQVKTLMWLTQCITLPREVRINATGLLLQNAQSQGLVPGPGPLDESANPKVFLFPMGEGRAVKVLHFSTPRELRDVHFFLLGWAINRWILAQPTHNGSYPLLELPCEPGRPAKKHVLYGVRDAVPPDRFSDAAIRASYTFTRPIVPAMPFSTVEVLDELCQVAAAQADLRREPGFRQALEDLIGVHSGLLQAARYRLTDGTLESVCLLQDPNGWGSRAMGHQWMEPYRAIAEATVGILEDDNRFFTRAATVSERLVYWAGEQPQDVLVHLMLPSTLLMYYLGLWWSRRAATDAMPDAHGPRLLSAPLRNVYRESVQRWVGSWEQINVLVNVDAKLGEAQHWSAHITRVKVYAAHVDETARLLLAAVARSDAEAARKLEDALIKWWGQRYHQFDTGRAEPQHEWHLLTLDIANLSWEQARGQLPNLPDGPHAAVVASQVLAVVMKRYWTDVCLVTALVLLEHATNIEYAENSLCIEIVGSLMAGQGYDMGGMVDVDRYESAETAVARLTRALFSSRAYSQRLDKIVERFQSDTREPMTPGRIYSIYGTEDVVTLTRGQAIYLAALVASSHDMIYTFTRIVEAWSDNLQKLSRISRHFDSLAVILRQETFSDYLAIIGRLRSALDRTIPVAEAVIRAAAICVEAAEIVSKAHDTTVSDAPLDPDRLVELAARVHSRVFTHENQSEFPIAVMTKFAPTDDLLEKVSQRFTGVSKLPFTTPQLETLDGHLVYWFSKHIAVRGFAIALARLQRRLGIEPIRDDHAEAFYSDLLARIDAFDSANITPVILVASGQRIDYLSPYRLPEDGDLPAGFFIRPPDNPGSDLYATVNGVEVYVVPMISSRYLVLPKDKLTTIHYQKQLGDIGVLVYAENESEGKLDLTFEFACDFLDTLPA